MEGGDAGEPQRDLIGLLIQIVDSTPVVSARLFIRTLLSGDNITDA